MPSLLGEKSLVTVGVFVSTIVFGFLPYKLVSIGPSFSQYLTLSSCFSGGVFLSAFFLDLLPDINEAFENVMEESNFKGVDDFPLPSFFIMIGFFLVLILEQMIHAYKDRHHYELIPFEESEADKNEEERLPEQVSVLRSFILLVALSFHSFFEGLAIGLQKKENYLLALVFAVMFHKGIMSFSLGINLSKAQILLKIYAGCVMIFSLASPIGIAVGMGLMNLPECLARDIATCVLQAIAGGTFLYITFIEVLFHELNADMHQGPDRMLRLLSILLGFASLTVLLLIFPL